jgi:nicotinamidase-related amidase
MRIERQHATAIVVDIQERLFPHIHEHEALAQRCAMFIKGLRTLKIPIVVTQQYTKGLGPTIPAIADALGEFEPMEKRAFSATTINDVEAIVLGTRGHQIILLGIETHVCIQQTALDILAQGRGVVVIEDCVSSRNANDKRIAIERMRSAGAVITTAESMLFEILETSESEAFKQISALVK